MFKVNPPLLGTEEVVFIDSLNKFMKRPPQINVQVKTQARVGKIVKRPLGTFARLRTVLK